jgi:MoxR-like ATPase
MAIVESAVKKNGLKTDISLDDIDEEKKELEKEINKEILHSTDVYKTVTLNKKQYFKCTKKYNHGYDNKNVTFYILKKYARTKTEFNPADEQGNEINWIKCNFDGQGVCNIKINAHGENYPPYLNQNNHWADVNSFKPKILFHKGDKKSDVNPRLISSLKKATLELDSKIQKTTELVEAKLKTFKNELDTPFIPDNIRDITLEGIISQVKSLKLRKKDCERIMGLMD